MKYIHFLTLVAGLMFSGRVFSQVQVTDTLPEFTVRNVGKNIIIIGWVNQFEKVSQISIQMAPDSLGAYKTILSVADPNAVQNGFAYTKAQHGRMFYRLFVVLDRASYIFTNPKRPVMDTARVVSDLPVVLPRDTSRKTFEQVKDYVNLVKPRDSLIIKRPEIINQKIVPSSRVFTNRDGYVTIRLPDAERKQYRIKFFENDGTLLFEVKNVKSTTLMLDKTNFYHSGWFKFELYDDTKLIEVNSFFMTRVF